MRKGRVNWTLINGITILVLVVWIIGIAVGRWDKKTEVREELSRCRPGNYVYLESVNAGCDAVGKIHVYDSSHKRVR